MSGDSTLDITTSNDFPTAFYYGTSSVEACNSIYDPPSVQSSASYLKPPRTTHVTTTEHSHSYSSRNSPPARSHTTFIPIRSTSLKSGPSFSPIPSRQPSFRSSQQSRSSSTQQPSSISSHHSGPSSSSSFSTQRATSTSVVTSLSSKGFPNSSPLSMPIQRSSSYLSQQSNSTPSRQSSFSSSQQSRSTSNHQPTSTSSQTLTSSPSHQPSSILSQQSDSSPYRHPNPNPSPAHFTTVVEPTTTVPCNEFEHRDVASYPSSVPNPSDSPDRNRNLASSNTINSTSQRTLPTSTPTIPDGTSIKPSITGNDPNNQDALGENSISKRKKPFTPQTIDHNQTTTTMNNLFSIIPISSHFIRAAGTVLPALEEAPVSPLQSAICSKDTAGNIVATHLNNRTIGGRPIVIEYQTELSSSSSLPSSSSGSAGAASTSTSATVFKGNARRTMSSMGLVAFLLFGLGILVLKGL